MYIFLKDVVDHCPGVLNNPFFSKNKYFLGYKDFVDIFGGSSQN